MTDGTNPADTRCDLRHFKIQTSFAEFFKSAKFVYVHIGAPNSAIILHVDGDLGMTFDTSNGFNSNLLCHSKSPVFPTRPSASAGTHPSVQVCVPAPAPRARKRSCPRREGSLERCSPRGQRHEWRALEAWLRALDHSELDFLFHYSLLQHRHV